MPERKQEVKGWDDAPLVEKAKRGHAGAWQQLVDRYSDYVYTLLRASRVPDADLPDAFQYVFIELFRGLSKLEQTRYLAPWIRQTTIRHAIKLRTKSARETGLPDGELASEDSVAADLEASETRLAVHQALSTLKDQCRELVRLLFFEEPSKSYAEIASSLGLSIGSLGQTRQRCLEALKRALLSRGIG